jgi:LDH2 family malate/lactate/ureidoglycolate dehydrogenase
VSGTAGNAPDTAPTGAVAGAASGAADLVTVDAAALERAVAACFTGFGVPAGDAALVAEVLVYADLRGLTGHGVYRAPAYLERVRRGLAGGTRDMAEIGGVGAARRIDAGYALGPAAATRAVDRAIELARTHGVGLVALRRTTHLGAAGFYVQRAARAGMVAIVTSNGPKAVAPHGAAEAFLGTNPLAVGMPLGRHGELVLDMSTAAMPREQIRIAAAAGREIPPGMAVDPAGRPTTDAAAAMAGSVLPVGGVKGSGLSLVVALLAGLLCDAEFDDEIGSMYSDFDRPQNLGQVFVVIDPGPARSARAGPGRRGDVRGPAARSARRRGRGRRVVLGRAGQRTGAAPPRRGHPAAPRRAGGPRAGLRDARPRRRGGRGGRTRRLSVPPPVSPARRPARTRGCGCAPPPPPGSG